MVDECASPKLHINAGVPQGSVLGPTLFLLFIDDLREKLHNSLHLFADDATLDAQIDSSASIDTVCKSLQADLNYIEAWSKMWCVVFNPLKYHCESFVMFRKRQCCNVKTFVESS